ncbi:uncharacterized protein [Narcine bancroftii]|uniref:uncharacterized protein isoform X3 n=1 Tax=Narcine bancroftii TaxID=1343680 RepID=UPI0038317D4B
MGSMKSTEGIPETSSSIHQKEESDEAEGQSACQTTLTTNKRESHYSLKQIWRENSRYQSSATQQTARVQKRGTSSDATSEAGTKGRSKCRKPTKKQEAATELQRFLRKLDLVDQELEWERRERQRHMEMMQAQSWEREADRQQPGKQ